MSDTTIITFCDDTSDYIVKAAGRQTFASAERAELIVEQRKASPEWRPWSEVRDSSGRLLDALFIRIS